MADWWLMFQNGMNEYFHIAPNMVIPALISLVMIIGIVTLILYEAFKRITDNEGLAGGIAILVAIATGAYMMYNGSILAIASFGMIAIVAAVVIFFVILVFAFFHRARTYYYKEKKEAKEAKNAYRSALHQGEEQAMTTIDKFWDIERKAGGEIWTELRKIKKIDEKNAEAVAEALSNIIQISEREKSVCERWRKYFIKEFGRWSPETKFVNKLIRDWDNINLYANMARSYVQDRDYKEAEKLVNEIKGVSKKLFKTSENGESETEKEIKMKPPKKGSSLRYSNPKFQKKNLNNEGAKALPYKGAKALPYKGGYEEVRNCVWRELSIVEENISNYLDKDTMSLVNEIMKKCGDKNRVHRKYLAENIQRYKEIYIKKQSKNIKKVRVFEGELISYSKNTNAKSKNDWVIIEINGIKNMQEALNFVKRRSKVAFVLDGREFHGKIFGTFGNSGRVVAKIDGKLNKLPREIKGTKVRIYF